MAYQPATVVEVRAWDKTVGAVAGGSGQYEFQFDPAWKRTGIDLSPLLMPAGSSRSRFSFPALGEQTFHRLPPMLADALPDKFGNAIVDAWLATQGVAKSSITPLARLAYLGGRGMGALEFVPDSDPTAPRPSALDLNELVTAARAAVAGTLSDETTTHHALNQIISVGTSAGGARPKAVVNVDDVTGEIRPGQTIPTPDETAWLLKFDGVGEDIQLGESRQYTRIEYAYSEMARAAGITMTETRLLRENGRAHFLTRRFDRDGSDRVHMQTLCGIDAVDFNLRETNDYAQLFTVANQLGLDADARTQIFRRMAFNVAASNHDDHSKNHSFLLRQGGAWELAPAYDITFAHDAQSVWLNQHLMSVNGKFADITRKDVLAVADRFNVPGAKVALADVRSTTASWEQFAADADLGRNVIDDVRGGFVAI
jgi:serine/threonine-protein kinase HipA